MGEGLWEIDVISSPSAGAVTRLARRYIRITHGP